MCDDGILVIFNAPSLVDGRRYSDMRVEEKGLTSSQ